MKNYIFAENLKHKHSFLLKILFIAPIISLIFELKRIGNNINQIARSINYSNLITEVELYELRKGIEELIVEVEKDFLIQSEKLRKFYGHH